MAKAKKQRRTLWQRAGTKLSGFVPLSLRSTGTLRLRAQSKVREVRARLARWIAPA